VDYRGGWTKILGGKASEPETSRSIETRNFYLTRLHYFGALIGIILSEFRQDLLRVFLVYFLFA